MQPMPSLTSVQIEQLATVLARLLASAWRRRQEAEPKPSKEAA